MNRTEFVNQVAQILFDAGIRMAYEEDSYKLEECPALVIPQITGMYRDFMGECEVSFVLPHNATATELWDLVYADCFRSLRHNDDLNYEIDSALYNMQHRKDPDHYDTTVEEKWRA